MKTSPLSRWRAAGLADMHGACSWGWGRNTALGFLMGMASSFKGRFLFKGRPCSFKTPKEALREEMWVTNPLENPCLCFLRRPGLVPNLTSKEVIEAEEQKINPLSDCRMWNVLLSLGLLTGVEFQLFPSITAFFFTLVLHYFLNVKHIQGMLLCHGIRLDSQWLMGTLHQAHCLLNHFRSLSNHLARV